jgi:hypothetical protein
MMDVIDDDVEDTACRIFRFGLALRAAMADPCAGWQSDADARWLAASQGMTPADRSMSVAMTQLTGQWAALFDRNRN